MRISRWGNSLAVRIPKDVVDELSLVEGDEIVLDQIGEKAFRLSKVTREEAVAWLRKFRGRMPADYRFDRDEANAR